ncbi:hypothetical protein EYF80_035184 [Liparis tanakae]|uniref:Uncharacterized protein n=1 Tax=Liparis tanakae TaxID=230148 RepID=A0A4Z2GPK2_9TELE|nr:hypothetical protein EYF80_035184 [Liparis tanakae]
MPTCAQGQGLWTRPLVDREHQDTCSPVGVRSGSHLSWLQEGNRHLSPAGSRADRQVPPHELQLAAETQGLGAQRVVRVMGAAALPTTTKRPRDFLKSTLVSALQQTDPVFLIFQYLMNLVPGRSRVPSGRFSSRKAAVMAGATRGHGRFGRLAGSKDSAWVCVTWLDRVVFSDLLGAAVLGGSRLQQDRGGASISVGGAPLYAPPLHPQLFPDLLDLCFQKALLRFQPLLLRLPEAAVASPVEPEGLVCHIDKDP